MDSENSAGGTTVEKLSISEEHPPIFNTVNKSQVGKGAHYKNKIIPTNGDGFYIPPDGTCFLKIMEKVSLLYQLEVDVGDLYKQFCVREKIRKDVVPLYKVGRFGTLMGIQLYKYDYDRGNLRAQNCAVRERTLPFKIVVGIHKNHYYIVWKDYKKNIDEIRKEQWIKEKDPSKLSLNVFPPLSLSKKDLCTSLEEQKKNTYVWDTETYWEDGKAVPFATGIKMVGTDSPPQCFTGEDCIIQMIKWLDYLHPKNGFYRTPVFLWAHNAKGFDNFLVLNTQIKKKQIIKNGSSLLRVVVLSDNCKIYFQCTMAHVPGSLASACVSFGLDQKDSKMGEEKGFSWEDITKE